VQRNQVVSNFGKPRRGKDYWLQRGLDASNNGERERQHEGVEEGIELLENGDVLHERTVPQESEHESADEDHEDEREEFGESVSSLASVNKALNHLSINNIFF